jgi:hypothetical protein
VTGKPTIDNGENSLFEEVNNSEEGTE